MYVCKHFISMDIHPEQLFQEEKFDLALAACERLLTAQPHQAEIHYLKAMCLLRLGRDKASLQSLDEACLLEPNNPFRYASRAYLRDRTGNLEGAIDDYRTAIHLDPEDAIAHNNLGLLLEKAGYQQAAAQHTQRADELSRQQPHLTAIAPPITAQESLPGWRDYLQTGFLVVRSRSAFRDFFSFVAKGFKF
jgi:Flp pilus assembly protein TadD